jgi:bacteriorhodopsin
LQVAADMSEVEQQIMVEASNVSVFFSAIFFFFLGVLIVGQHIQGDLHIVQRSILRKRLEYCMFVCLYICFFSCLFNVIQYGPQDDAVFDKIEARDTVILDIGRPIEWILTCPLMQLILPIMGGERVPDWRRYTMPLNSVVILLFGVSAMFSPVLPLKLGFYFCGVFCFCVLVWQMHRCINEATGGAETIYWGQSSLRTLAVIVSWTWVPFPIWYALSPEGFNIIQNSAAMKISVAFLNVLSKGAFIYYLMRVRGDLEVKEMVMAEARAVNGPEKGKLGSYGLEEKEEQRLEGKLASTVFEVLQAMGRQADFEPLKDVLQQNMITTEEDLLVLTQGYCDSIALPYGFVTACKARIKAHRVENQDKWNLNVDKGDRLFDSLSGATAPLPPQVANDPRKLKEHHRRVSSPAPGYDRQGTTGTPTTGTGGERGPFAQDPWNDGASEVQTPREREYGPSSSKDHGMTREELQAAISASQNVLLAELRDMKRQQVEEHSRMRTLEERVEGDLDAVQGMMGGMMTQVMDKIESRLRSTSPRGVPGREGPGSPLAQGADAQ